MATDRKKTLHNLRRSATHPPKATAHIPFLQVLSGTKAGFLLPLAEEAIVGRDPECHIAVDDPCVSWRHARLGREGDEYFIEDLQSTNGTFVGEELVTRSAIKTGALISLGEGLSLRFGHTSEAELQLAHRLFESATRDHLTKALNRGSFFETVEQEAAINKRQAGLFSLLLLDIDHFKSINDSYGHPAGDEVLRQVAQLLRSSSRLEDVLGRYGGEEFALLLRNTPKEGALEKAERLCRLVAEYTFVVPFADQQKSIPVTISIGVAAWDPGLSLERLVARADAALYRAKEEGRNCVRCNLVD